MMGTERRYFSEGKYRKFNSAAFARRVSLNDGQLE